MADRRRPPIATAGLWLTLALAAAGCGGSAATISPLPSGAPAATPSASATAGQPATLAPTDSASPTASASPSPSPSPTAAPTAVPTPPGCSGLTIASTTVSSSAADGSWTVSVKKPVVSCSSASVAAAVNARIGAALNEGIASFTAGLGSPFQGQPSTYSGTFSVAYASERLLSLRLPRSAYVSGAAHPTALVGSLNFDLATGAQLGLGDMFANVPKALSVLSAQSRSLLVARFGKDFLDTIDSGTQPVATNFAAWALTAAGLEITFGDYQVGPHAIGTPAVVVAWSALAAVVKPNGPAGSFVG